MLNMKIDFLHSVKLYHWFWYIAYIAVHLGKGVAWHENHQQSDNLRAVKLKTFRQNECDLIYGGHGDIKRQHLCAYYAGLITITGRGRGFLEKAK